ncbi:hypothetical protein ACVR1G_08255 [Streptococcus dentasini]
MDNHKKEIRVGVYMTPDIEEKLTALMRYRYGKETIRKKGVTIKDCISLCYDLLIENNLEETPFDGRVQELKGKKTAAEKIESRLKQMQRQQDELLYISLANFQLGQHGPNWDPFDLASRNSGRDPKQRDLFVQIDELIKADVSKSQTANQFHQ